MRKKEGKEEKEVNKEEIEKIMRKIKRRKAAGQDKIPNEACIEGKTVEKI